MGRPRKHPEDDILVAKESGVVVVNGETIYLRRDVTRVRASHPVAQAAAHLLQPLDIHYDIEAATANPGELRGQE